MSKLTMDDTLSFIDYLKEKEITIVPYTMTLFSYFNGRRTYNCTSMVRKLAEYIKTHTAEESYIKGSLELGVYENGINCNHKLFPKLRYSEDLEEYIESLIPTEKEREKILKSIRCGEYKFKYKMKKPKPFSDDFHYWAKAYCPLPSRSAWIKMFPFDFEFWLDKNKRRCRSSKKYLCKNPHEL